MNRFRRCCPGLDRHQLRRSLVPVFSFPQGRYPSPMKQAQATIGHFDLRVTSLSEALHLYSRMMPALGYNSQRKGDGWHSFVRDGELPARSFLPLIEDPAHQPNGNRLAFWVSSRGEVERLAEIVKQTGARTESGPRDCPEYASTYYALFFEDPCGNKLEIYHLVD